MSNPASLSAIKLLVTRPEGQQQNLCKALAAEQVKTVQMPLLKIEPLVDPLAETAIRQKIQQLDQYDKLIFISSNAAILGAGWIDRFWPQFPQGVRVFAIGPATARELTQRLDCQVFVPEQGNSSEDLLAGPDFQELEHSKIALFRGVGGRELLREQLQKRGALVDYIELYQRQAVPYPENHLAGLISSGQVNSLSVTSAQSLTILLQQKGINKSDLGLLPLLVPSERVRQQALAEGFQRVINTQGADEISILSGLRQLVQ